MKNSKLLLPILLASSMMDSIFGSHIGGTIYPTNNDPLPPEEVINTIRQKAEEKRLRKMNKRLKNGKLC